MLGRTKLNTIEVLISNFDRFNISCDEFISVNNGLKEYDDMKEKIKNSNDK